MLIYGFDIVAVVGDSNCSMLSLAASRVSSSREYMLLYLVVLLIGLNLLMLDCLCLILAEGRLPPIADLTSLGLFWFISTCIAVIGLTFTPPPDVTDNRLFAEGEPVFGLLVSVPAAFLMNFLLAWILRKLFISFGGDYIKDYWLVLLLFKNMSYSAFAIVICDTFGESNGITGYVYSRKVCKVNFPIRSLY